METDTQHSINENSVAHQLSCLEVWGGSSTADHGASVLGLDIHVHARPIGGTQGGDLYLISSCSSGWISRMLLADVSGHGEAVSHLSEKLRKAMHKSINTIDQSKLAKTLNTSFDEISGGTKFATALFMTYFAPSGHLVLVNAGHPPPFICRDGETAWKPFDEDHSEVITSMSTGGGKSVSNLPLGVIGSTEYEQIAIEFKDGDQICAYTDAYIEAITEDHQMLGVEGFSNVLAQVALKDIPPSDFFEAVADEIQSRGFTLAEDDHTLLHFQHNGQKATGVDFATVKNFVKNTFGFGHTDILV